MKPTTRSGRPGRKPGRKPKRVLKAAVGKKKPPTTPSPLGRRTRAQKAGSSVGDAGTSRSSAVEGGPIVSVSRRECFSAAHRLHNPALGDAQNARLYGKSPFRGPIDADTGMVYNLADLKEQLKAVLDQLDHKNLDKDVPFFKKNVSTVENIVHFIVVSLREQMDQPQLLHKVKVLETENNAASIVC
ncbi:6-pyruvoyl tetrahydrobiopterin synthase [Aphelenchoides fujianensis]|nr:6-pyruvoyl tetrahydrobiopterin synthase [Aphelenchoides fujianensis]